MEEMKHSHEHHHDCSCGTEGHEHQGCGCHHHHHHEEGGLKSKLFLIGATIILLIIAVFIEKEYSLATWQLLLVYLIPYLLIGHETLGEAAEGIAKGDMFNENFLMAIATIGALCIGFFPGSDTEFPEAVFVMLFFQVGELFEGYAEGKSRDSISHLMNIRPDVANVERNGKVESVSPEDVKIGETIVIRPGEKVPLDGIVVEGSSALNTIALTGESMPRDLNEGDTIMSGCINLSGVVRVRTTKSFGESTVSKIISLVESADKNKSKSEAFITRFARVYTPIVVFSHCPGGYSSIPGSYRNRRCRTLWRELPIMAQPRLDIPGSFLSLRPGHQRAPHLLWRHRRSIPERYSHQGQQLYGCFSQGGNRCVRQNRNSDPRRVCRGSCSC